MTVTIKRRSPEFDGVIVEVLDNWDVVISLSIKNKIREDAIQELGQEVYRAVQNIKVQLVPKPTKE